MRWEEIDTYTLEEWLQSWVETFNDCACCPLSNDCERRSITLECAEDLLGRLKE